MISSIKRSEGLSKYLVAVQSPYQKTENDATLGLHEQILRGAEAGSHQGGGNQGKDGVNPADGERRDYFTLMINSSRFVFDIEQDSSDGLDGKYE